MLTWKRAACASALSMICALPVSGCAASTEPTPAQTAQSIADKHAAITAISQCLRDRGWTVTVNTAGDWGLSAEYPNEQADAYFADLDLCQSEVGLMEQPQTPASLSTAYDQLVTVVNCLDEQQLPHGDLPSRADFVSHSLEDSNYAWDPYSEIQQSGLPTAITLCPQQ